MEFCKKHNRKNEFKEIIHLINWHLQDLLKDEVNTSNLPNPVSIENEKCFKQMLEFRMKAIDICIYFEHWADAY